MSESQNKMQNQIQAEPQNELAFYKDAYEKEHLRNADLAGRVADLEAKCDDLDFKLNRIKNNQKT